MGVMNIFEIYQSWGVQLVKVVNNGGRQAQLFVKCQNCFQEFTGENVLVLHKCTDLVLEKFQTGSFKNLFRVKEDMETEFSCKLCNKEMGNLAKLVKHFIKKHKSIEFEEYICDEWFELK